MKRGFTLIELLVVIVIIGVLVTMVGLSFTTGTDTVRVRTATRGVMQLSKYARTMALLHQTPLDLVFSSDGRVKVEAVGGGESSSLVSESSFGVTNASAETAEKKLAEESAPVADQAKSSGGGSSYVMADLALDRKYEQISFAFDGYTDSLDDKKTSGYGTASESQDEGETGDQAQTSFRVRYRSNGTCRPYKVRVYVRSDASENGLTVAINMLGSAKVEEDDE